MGGPLPPVPTPPNVITLEPVEQLGKDMLYDNTMSNPTGYACAQCHAPTAGYTSGLESIINLAAGVPPGVVPGRWDNRKAYAYSYAAYSPEGPYYDTTLGVYIGGNFWDGRAYDTAVQAQGPPINPNEMNNTPAGTAPNQYPPLLVKKLQTRPYTPLFNQIYGPDVFTKYTPRQIFEIWGEAIAAFEASGEVCQFSSKYDASQYGSAAAEPLHALRIRGAGLTGSGESVTFGLGGPMLPVPLVGGLPRRPARDGREGHVHDVLLRQHRRPQESWPIPITRMTDPVSNPTGYNPLGTNYIDWGLGANAVGGLDGTKFFNNDPGRHPPVPGSLPDPDDPQRPTCGRPRRSSRRTSTTALAKSLQEVVHFYNTRNIAVNASGQQVAFDLRNGPPTGYTAIWPPPEVLDNVQNVAGYTPAQAAAAGTTGVTATERPGGQLGLTASQEADLVNFLKILSDGYTAPNPRSATEVPIVPQ